MRSARGVARRLGLLWGGPGDGSRRHVDEPSCAPKPVGDSCAQECVEEEDMAMRGMTESKLHNTTKAEAHLQN